MEVIKQIRSMFTSKKTAHQGHQVSVETLSRDRFMQRMGALENFAWLLNRMPVGVAPKLQSSPSVAGIEDSELVRRVMTAYNHANSCYQLTDGFWDVWHLSLKKPVHDALIGNDFSAGTQILRDPASSVFFWGFDAVSSSPAGETEPHELVLMRLNHSQDWESLYAIWLCDSLHSLAEAVGARRYDYPEIDIDQTLSDRWGEIDVDSILDDISQELEVDLFFPNPYPNELGLRSKRGIVGFRSIQAIYQAWRISQLANSNPDYKVMEIGAGLGRTAYFARMFGVKNYTIVDIPMTNAAQGYFLGRTIGAENITLGGEHALNGLRILSSNDIPAHNEKYDLIINIDSLTEMSKGVADDYWRFIRKSTNHFLSINHEFNPHTVRELYKGEVGIKALRYPYVLRRGYVEEVLSW